MSTNATPRSGGRFATKTENASNPPAEAPIPMTVNGAADDGALPGSTSAMGGSSRFAGSWFSTSAWARGLEAFDTGAVRGARDVFCLTGFAGALGFLFGIFHQFKPKHQGGANISAVTSMSYHLLSHDGNRMQRKIHRGWLRGDWAPVLPGFLGKTTDGKFSKRFPVPFIS